MLVDQVTHITNVLFKHSIGGWVCKHDCCQVLLVFIHLWGRKEQRETKEKMFILSKTLLFTLKDEERWCFGLFISGIVSNYDDNKIHYSFLKSFQRNKNPFRLSPWSRPKRLFWKLFEYFGLNYPRFSFGFSHLNNYFRSFWFWICLFSQLISLCSSCHIHPYSLSLSFCWK